MVAPVSKFYGKFGLVFVLTLEISFSYRFHFKANRKRQVFLKNGTRDFQNSALFERLASFYVIITGNFKRFQYLNFEADLENENLFQKTGYHF